MHLRQPQGDFREHHHQDQTNNHDEHEGYDRAVNISQRHLRRRHRAHQEQVVAERRLAETEVRIRRIVAAIADGTDTPAMRQMLLELEDKKSALGATLAEIERPHVIELHPNLADVYRRKVEALEASLSADEEIRREAVPILRSLIHRIVLQTGEKRGEMIIEVHSEPGAVLALASGDPTVSDQWMIKVVAEEGLEPPTRGL